MLIPLTGSIGPFRFLQFSWVGEVGRAKLREAGDVARTDARELYGFYPWGPASTEKISIFLSLSLSRVLSFPLFLLSIYSYILYNYVRAPELECARSPGYFEG